MPQASFKIQRSSNYIKIQPLRRSWGQVLAYPFVKTMDLVWGLPALALGRLLAIVIFNPLATINPEQDDRQFQQSSSNPDPLHRKDFAVINVTEKPSFITRIIRNYMRRLGSTLNPPRFIQNFMARYILRINQVDANGCDEALRKFMRHYSGESLIDSRVNPIDADSIFIKGTEFINPRLREHFFNAINRFVNNQDIERDGSFDIRNNQQKLNFFTLESRDGAILDSVEIVGDGEADRPYKERTFVICCMPRSNSYTAWIKRHRVCAEQIGTTYIDFNYRGVERSNGLVWTQNDMVRDATAQAERLLACGVKPQNIAFEGECLGAAIATLAAEKMHQQGFKVKLFNTRSFRSTSKLVLYKILPKQSASLLNPINWLRYVFAGLFICIGIPLLKITSWNLDAADAYNRIPAEDKSFLAAKSDPMVESSHASIFSAVQVRHEKLKALVKSDLATKAEKAELKAIGKMSAHRFSAPSCEEPNTNQVTNSHTCPLQQLHGRRGGGRGCVDSNDARQYKINFFKAAFNKDTATLVNDRLINAESATSPELLAAA